MLWKGEQEDTFHLWVLHPLMESWIGWLAAVRLWAVTSSADWTPAERVRTRDHHISPWTGIDMFQNVTTHIVLIHPPHFTSLAHLQRVNNNT